MENEDFKFIEDFITFMTIVLALVLIFCIGFATGLREEPHTEATFENCNKLVIDTISYNHTNNTYTFKVSKL